MKQAGKVIIIGAGHVGSHAAYALASQGLAGEIVLIDIDREKAAAQVLDIGDRHDMKIKLTFMIGVLSACTLLLQDSIISS